MIIGIAGYGYSGASAYIDVLKEFDGMQSLANNNEFPIFQQTDGVFDLRHALVEEPRRLNVSSAVVRFTRNTQDTRSNKLEKLSGGRYSKLSKAYIESLTDVSWKGRSAFDPGDIRNKLEQPVLNFPNRVIRKILRIFNKKAIWPRPKDRFFTMVTPERFQEETQKYVKELLLSLNFDLGQDIILEQVFNTLEPLKGAEYFEGEVLSLVIDRDPRDIFLLTNILHPEKCSFMPCGGSVEDFVYYYKALHRPGDEDPRILRMNFEDLVFYHDETIGRLEERLHRKIVRKGTTFKPERSVNNVHMFRNYPQYEKEFRYIEEHCAEYLYDFETAERNSHIERLDVKPF
ncbi:MAG: hypothetical protein J6Y95_03455 [Lachnospiraceae bacterium]|nr:hypothetical protein [Lachnospiraceae bacterium]